jgi:hypothetical protein
LSKVLEKKQVYLSEASDNIEAKNQNIQAVQPSSNLRSDSSSRLVEHTIISSPAKSKTSSNTSPSRKVNFNSEIESTGEFPKANLMNNIYFSSTDSINNFGKFF